MQITVKVNLHGDKEPAAVVRERLNDLRPEIARQAPVEEVFPGLRSGNRAGMVTVQLPHDLADEDVEAVLEALRSDKDIQYAEPATPRTHRLRR